jgi:hypothetical protein
MNAKTCLCVTRPCYLQSRAKCKNDGGYRRSKSVAMPFLWCLPNGKTLVLFFLSLGNVQPILAPVFRRSVCGLLNRTKSPVSMVFHLTFLCRQALISFW